MTQQDKSQHRTAGIKDKGFKLKSPCGREYFYPLSAAHEDYAQAVVQMDGVTLTKAREYVSDQGEQAVIVWFLEQTTWHEIQSHGTLIKDASPEEVRQALDFAMRSYSGAPQGDVEYIGIEEPR